MSMGTSKKKEKPFLEERHNQILALLHKNGKIVVTDLANSFHVSGATIRQDLSILERRGLLVRTHGGAVLEKTIIDSPSLAERNAIRLPQKIAIAEKAMEFVSKGNSLILDGGTTILEFAKKLKESRLELKVVVNFMPHIQEFEKIGNVKMIVTGGSYHGRLRCFTGPFAIDSLSHINVDTTFISTTGISVTKGLSCSDPEDAEVKRVMLQRARRRILLADSSKIGCDSFITVCNIHGIDAIVTDWELPPEKRKEFEEQGIQVYIAPEGKN